jgi:adenylate cyclase
MTSSKISKETIKEVWYSYLTTGNMPASLKPPWFERKAFRPLIKRLPKSPRCDICYMPFGGIGGWFSKALLDVTPSKLNPHLCNLCERHAIKYNGGVELEISILFVDVRGSTSMAENISAEEFRAKIERFYRAATEVFYRNNGFVEKLLGDEVAGFFVPGFAGPAHAKVALDTGKKIMKAMGYGGASKPWMPVGMGINTGVAYVGTVNAASGITDISMLGDAVNTAARLTSLAGPGEILISEAARTAADLPPEGMEARDLKLKGKQRTVRAWAMRMTA